MERSRRLVEMARDPGGGSAEVHRFVGWNVDTPAVNAGDVLAQLAPLQPVVTVEPIPG